MGRGARLSSGSFGGEQTGIGVAPPASINASAAAAAPSWLLPKRTPPATVAGSSPILGQFRGVSLTDPGTVNGLGRSSSNQGT